jgi:hypothetical protein
VERASSLPYRHPCRHSSRRGGSVKSSPSTLARHNQPISVHKNKIYLPFRFNSLPASSPPSLPPPC